MRFPFICLLLVLFSASPALAQFDTASVVGTVRDPSGGVVSDAKVTLTNAETATVTIVVRPAQSGTIVNSATVTAAEQDPRPADNSDTVTTRVR